MFLFFVVIQPGKFKTPLEPLGGKEKMENEPLDEPLNEPLDPNRQTIHPTPKPDSDTAYVPLINSRKVVVQHLIS